MLMFHGSPYGGLTTFDDVRRLPVFFTPEERVAREYAFGRDMLAAQADPGTGGPRRPTVYRVDVEGVSPFDTRKPDHLRLYERWRVEMIRDNPDDEDVRHDYPRSTSPGFIDSRLHLPSFGHVRPLWRMLEEKAPGRFDSVWTSEGSQGPSLAVFEPRGKTRVLSMVHEGAPPMHAVFR